MRDKAGQTVGREGISAQTGCISPAPSFLTFPTAFPTGYTASPASGHGLTSACTCSAAVAPFSHAHQSPGAKITGMRSCSGRIAALASVVTIVKVSSSSPSAGRVQRSHSPARAKNSPPTGWM